MPGPVFIRGERVTLRTREREDAAFRHEHVNHPDLRTVLGVRRPHTAEYENAAFEHASTDDEAIRLMICVDGEPVGHVALWITDRAVSEAELGLWLVPDAQGAGYGSAAARLLVGHGFDQLNLHRITAEDVLDTNEASKRMLTGLGFVEEGRHRDASFADGEYHDTHDFAVLADEWDHPSNR